MATHNDQADRLNELEMKIVLADDMLDQLNQTIFRQQQQIDALAQEVRNLRQQLPVVQRCLRTDKECQRFLVLGMQKDIRNQRLRGSPEMHEVQTALV